MPFMGTDLGKLMKLQTLSEEKIQYLVYQILKGLKVRSAALICCQYIINLNTQLLQSLLHCFITVYPFCWHHSQGRLSLICILTMR